MSGVSKTLSHGTLSLRFMQNAHRSKQMVEVEAEKAQVASEAKWEVSKDVRDAWGVEPARSSSAVVHETSYLPFLFPSLPDPDDAVESPVRKVKGRRKFNKNGQEDVEDEKPVPVEEPTEITMRPAVKWASGSKRPISISGSGATQAAVSKDAKKGIDRKQSVPTSRTKSALTMIGEIRDVGADLRRSGSLHTTEGATQAPPRSFLKPSGIDDPTGPATAKRETESRGDIINGARAKEKKRRDRVSDGGQAGGDEEMNGKKRRKKPKVAES